MTDATPSLRILTVSLGVITCQLQAQNWAAAGLPGRPANIQQVVADTNGDTIYYAGAIRLYGNDFAPTNPVMRYATGQWDTLGVLHGQIMTMIEFRDTLIAGGQFTEASGVPCQGIAYFDGSIWHPYGELGSSVRRLRVLENELYAVGGFQLADGVPASGIAKRVGNSWVPVGQFDMQASILDITFFDGSLIAIGGAYVNGGRGIIEWDGEEWSLLGPGILGGFSGARCLQVFQDDLYVGGQIALDAGNAGQNIMRWDGTQFHGIGQGIQRELGNTTAIATVFAFAVHNDMLFVGGGFRAAGGILADGLATWDGTEWCAVPGDFTTTNGIMSMDFLQDTLFTACGVTLDGDSVNMAAKFIGSVYTNECSGPVGIYDTRVSTQVRLQPNPGKDEIMIIGASGSTISAHDVLGQCMLRQTGAKSDQVIEAGSWSIGLYIITITDHNGYSQVLRWVKE